MILHIDMDAFYASVELRDQPELKGKPVVVGGSPKGRGVISAASYEARKFGVHSAMSSAQALRLCPNLIFIKPRMNYYAAISKQIRQIFFEFTSLVEPISLDEAFLDVSGCVRLFGTAVNIAEQIKQRIQDETGLIASAGVAPNKFLAKVASDLDKPDGLTVVDADDIHGFLDPLPIRRIWGIGKVTEQKFTRIGIGTVGDLRRLSAADMRSMFGINSEHFWRLARGIDSRHVVPDRHAKSISHETTFHQDIRETEILNAWMLELSDQVARRMRRYEIVGKTVNVKIRFGDFRTITRANTLPEPTSVTRTLAESASNLLLHAVAPDNESTLRGGIRLLGMGVSSLGRPREKVQLDLFDQQETDKQKRIDQANDAIRDRFGSTSIRRASSVQHNVRHERRPDLNEP